MGMDLSWKSPALEGWERSADREKERGNDGPGIGLTNPYCSLFTSKGCQGSEVPSQNALPTCSCSAGGPRECPSHHSISFRVLLASIVRPASGTKPSSPTLPAASSVSSFTLPFKLQQVLIIDALLFSGSTSYDLLSSCIQKHV